MSIKIGDDNTIKNSTIVDGNNNIVTEDKSNQTWIKKHPVISSFLVSLISGIVLMFSFWQEGISFIENIFR